MSSWFCSSWKDELSAPEITAVYSINSEELNAGRLECGKLIDREVFGSELEWNRLFMASGWEQAFVFRRPSEEVFQAVGAVLVIICLQYSEFGIEVFMKNSALNLFGELLDHICLVLGVRY